VFSSTHGCVRLGRRRTRAAISTAAALVAAAALAGPASAQLTAAGPVDPDTGFPQSYTDAAGQTVDLCVDADECGGGTVPRGGGDEAFYWSADLADIPLSGGGTVAAIYKASRAGLLRVTLRDRALLRRLRAGQYIVEVRPGASRTALGATARRTFRVTR
jgi:hypothetical protein